MASSSDPEKVETGTIDTESSSYQSDGEKVESHKDEEGAIGEPDIDHEDVERMNPEHLEDLERQRVSVMPHDHSQTLSNFPRQEHPSKQDLESQPTAIRSNE
jgi:hypothetical protein